MRVQVGTTAPDFELGSHRGDTVRLSDFRGRKHVVIAFHPLAFTPVCATQMQNYEADQTWFGAHETHVLGISVDSVPAKIEWAKTLDVRRGRPLPVVGPTSTWQCEEWRLPFRVPAEPDTNQRKCPSAVHPVSLTECTRTSAVRY